MALSAAHSATKVLLVKPHKDIVVQRLQEANCASHVHFCNSFCAATCNEGTFIAKIIVYMRQGFTSMVTYIPKIKYTGRDITPVLFTSCHCMKLNLECGVLSVRQEYSDQPPFRTYSIQKVIQDKFLHHFLKV